MRLLALFALIAVVLLGCSSSSQETASIQQGLIATATKCPLPVKGQGTNVFKAMLKREACLATVRPSLSQLEEECQPRSEKSPRKIVMSQPAGKQLLVKWEKPESATGLVSYTVMIFPQGRIATGHNIKTVPAGTEEYLFAGAELENAIKYNTTYNAYMIATYATCSSETAIQDKQFITPVNGDIIWKGDGSEVLYKQWNSTSSSLTENNCGAINTANNTATTTARSPSADAGASGAGKVRLEKGAGLT